MLNNYITYKKIEKLLNEKFEELNRENFFHVGKAILPIIIVYWYKTSTQEFIIKYSVLLILFFLLLNCFKTIRMPAINFFSDFLKGSLPFVGSKYEIKYPSKVVKSFFKEYPYHFRELVFLQTIFSNTNKKSIVLYTLVAKEELENIKTILIDINKIISRPPYHKHISKEDLEKLTLLYENIKNYYVELIKTISEEANEINPTSDILQKELFDLKNFILDI
jgi:hypothetical protein